MSLRPLGILAIVMLGLAAVSQAVEVQPTDLQAVLRRYVDAQNADDVDAALALDSYRRPKVAPVQQNSEILVEMGKSHPGSTTFQQTRLPGLSRHALPRMGRVCS